MVRTFLCSLALLAFVAGGLTADDQKNKNQNTQGSKSTAQSDQGRHKCEAKITHVDPKKGQITVRMKDKNGKEVEKTFTLTEDVRMLDDTGRVAAMDVFQSGNDVLVIEGEGRLREIHKQRPGANTNNRNDRSK